MFNSKEHFRFIIFFHFEKKNKIKKYIVKRKNVKFTKKILLKNIPKMIYQIFF